VVLEPFQYRYVPHLDGLVAELSNNGIVSEFDSKIEHRPGTQHRNAHALNRIPCKQCEFTVNWDKQNQDKVVVQVIMDDFGLYAVCRMPLRRSSGY
jgi:hypothetical protein